MTADTSNSAPLRLTTEVEAPHRRAELAREVFGKQMLRVDVEPVDETDFEVDLKMLQLPGAKLGLGKVQGADTARTKSLLTDGNDDLFLTIVLEGRLIGEQRNECVILEPGSAHLVSNAEPFSFAHQQAKVIGLAVPHHSIAELVLDVNDRLSRPLPPSPAALAMLRGYVGTLMTAPSIEGANLTQTAATHMQDLIGHILGPTKDGKAIIASRSLRIAQLRAIKAHIDRNLSNHDLSIDLVAATHRLNRRYVQRLFEQEGSNFSAYVAAERLNRARSLLQDTRHLHRTVSGIARDCGFSDATHFSRQFRARYEQTPSDIRAVTKAMDGKR